jgi:conjugative transposon TraM protein
MSISLKMQRQRQFLIVLPLLIIPFLTMAFWALGGGKNAAADNSTGAGDAGVNPELPGAALKDDAALDKLAYYNQAMSDSLKLLEQMKTDPYFSKVPSPADSLLDALAGNMNTNPGITSSPQRYTGTSFYADPNEAKVYAKLGQLNAALRQTGNPQDSTGNIPPAYEPQAGNDPMEQLLATAANPAASTLAIDPEMTQLNGMLDKILDIQHPERLAGQPAVKKDDATGASPLSISTGIGAASFSVIDTGSLPSTGQFFGRSDRQASRVPAAISAVVHESQTLVTGAVVKMRLLSDIYINGTRIAKDHFVFGIASLNKERLEISVSSIRYGAAIYPVKMEVYDMDGLAGIYIPGAIGRDVAKQSADNALQSVALGSVDPSLGMQAASAGIETVKTLLSRKVKLIKVQVKAGYKILLQTTSH